MTSTLNDNNLPIYEDESESEESGGHPELDSDGELLQEDWNFYDSPQHYYVSSQHSDQSSDYQSPEQRKEDEQRQEANLNPLVSL